MKRFRHLLAMLSATVTVAMSPQPARAQLVLGDCNCNGSLDAGDPVCTVLRVIGSFTETCFSVCGDAVIESGEDCDLNDTSGGGQSCSSLGLGTGSLACGAGCRFDTSGCVVTTTTTSTTVPVCGVDPVPPGGSCPPVCSTCSGGDTCRIDCVASSCADTMVSCPPGFHCEVECGAGFCDTATIDCPPDFSCSVSCQGTNACNAAVVNCSTDGVCSMTCGSASGACDGASLICGTDACSVSCLGASQPAVQCGSSCSCTGSCF
jgi:hypothetical protein